MKLVDPPHLLALSALGSSLFTFCGENTDAVLFTVLPVAFIRPAVGPFVSAFAVTRAVQELAFVDPSVGPTENAKAVDVAARELPFVRIEVRPYVRSVPFE